MLYHPYFFMVNEEQNMCPQEQELKSYMINVIGKTSYPAYWTGNLRKDFICIVRMLLPKAFTWPGKYC